MAGHQIADQALSRDKCTLCVWHMSCHCSIPAWMLLGTSGKFLGSGENRRCQQLIAPVALVVSSCCQTGTYDQQVVMLVQKRYDSVAEQSVVCSETLVTSNFMHFGRFVFKWKVADSYCLLI